MRTILKAHLFTILFIVLANAGAYAQQNGQLFRKGSGIFRVAEPGQLADSVNIWGDVANTGRFLIPENTTLPELISYAGGPQNLGRGLFKMSDVEINISISRYNEQAGKTNVTHFEFDYQDAVPPKIYTYPIKNDDIITVEVNRNPNVLDYIKVIGPIITTLTSILILSNRL